MSFLTITFIIWSLWKETQAEHVQTQANKLQIQAKLAQNHAEHVQTPTQYQFFQAEQGQTQNMKLPKTVVISTKNPIMPETFKKNPKSPLIRNILKTLFNDTKKQDTGSDRGFFTITIDKNTIYKALKDSVNNRIGRDNKVDERKSIRHLRLEDIMRKISKTFFLRIA